MTTRKVDKDELWEMIKGQGWTDDYVTTIQASSKADLKKQVNEYVRTLESWDCKDYSLQYTGPGAYAVTGAVSSGDESGTRGGRLVVDAAYVREGGGNVDITKAAGYSRLSQPAKDFFGRMVKRHQAAVGTAYKAGWTPVKVQERRDHLRVTFRNGDWLHYWRDGTWG